VVTGVQTCALPILTIYFIFQKDLFFSISSILFDFLILTLIAIKEVKYNQ
jgi:hypothetical protein